MPFCWGAGWCVWLALQVLPVADSHLQKKVGGLYSHLRPSSRSSVLVLSRDTWNGVNWLWTGTSSSTWLVMWPASSVLAWKETAHCFLGSSFAGWTGWVSVSRAQTHSGALESQGVKDTALGSGGGVGSPVSLPAPSKRDCQCFQSGMLLDFCEHPWYGPENEPGRELSRLLWDSWGNLVLGSEVTPDMCARCCPLCALWWAQPAA